MKLTGQGATAIVLQGEQGTERASQICSPRGVGQEEVHRFAAAGEPVVEDADGESLGGDAGCKSECAICWCIVS